MLQQDIVDILQANTRVPRSNWGDLNGQLNALDLGERRFLELIDHYGDAIVANALQAASARAETMMRHAIRALPDGRYSFEDYLDNDGIIDEKLTIALDMTIAGDTMRLDFSRSSPPCLGPVNIARATAISCCYVALKHVFIDVPANAGCLVPITFDIPDGTFLGVGPPKPVAGYTETILRMIGVIFGALAQADPAKATAAPFGTINALSIAGYRPGGERWVMFSFFGGGLGGNPQSDGLNHANNPISTATMPPAEVLEASYPIMFTQWALRPDSGGAGAHRGGLGAIYEIEILDAGGADVSLLGERGRFAPFGVAGGGPAALNRFRWQTGGGWSEPPMISKVTGIKLKRGERLRLETPGGGGWGDPADRAVEAIAADLANGFVSADGARAVYNREIKSDGSIERFATAAGRSEPRA